MKKAIIVIMVLSMMSCTNSLIMKMDKPSHVVEYIVTGDTQADITLSNKDGITVQYENVQLPKSYKYDDFIKNFAFISANTKGDVTVQIIVDGELVSQSSTIDIAIADYYIERPVSK